MGINMLACLKQRGNYAKALETAAQPGCLHVMAMRPRIRSSEPYVSQLNDNSSARSELDGAKAFFRTVSTMDTTVNWPAWVSLASSTGG